VKLLTIVIPSYNSEGYLDKAVESCMAGGTDVEVLIVNDGSKDRTGEIADAWAAKYPETVRAIHQENGGHGEVINVGIREAKGLYFKVLDSDDQLDPEGYMVMLERLRGFVETEERPDLIFTDFLYDRTDDREDTRVHFENAMPMMKLFDWNTRIRFRVSQYAMIHALTYRTETLRESGYVLPKHTYYEDNLYTFCPAASVEKLWYEPVLFYHYTIGREGQSVTEEIMIRRLDQQMKVNRLMIDFIAEHHDLKKNQERYMLHYMDSIMCVSSIMSILSGTEESLKKKDDLWQYLKDKDPERYRKMRHSLFGVTMNLPGRGGRWIAKKGYHLANRIVGFN